MREGKRSEGGGMVRWGEGGRGEEGVEMGREYCLACGEGLVLERLLQNQCECGGPICVERKKANSCNKWN